MLYNIHYDICAIFIALFSIIFILTKTGLRRRQNRILLITFFLCIFSAVFDIASSVTISYPKNFSYAVRDLTNYGYLISHNCLIILLTLYIATITGLVYENSLINKKVLFIFAPFGIDLFMFATNPFLKLVFYYDENDVYLHGAGMYVLYFIAFGYLIFHIFLVKKYEANISKSLSTLVYFYIICTIFTIIIQFIFPSLLISLCAESLCLLGFMLCTDTDTDLMDTTTDIFNRQAFIQRNTILISNSNTYHLLIIHINRLNLHTASLGIRNTNGFLKMIGDYLYSTFKNTNSYYCDNGNFVLLTNDSEDLDELSSTITKRFSENWHFDKSEVIFEISLQSIDVPGDINTVEEILLSVDSTAVNDSTIFDNALNDKQTSVSAFRREQSVEKAIDRALATEGFTLLFQPIWNSSKNTISSAEALIRLDDEELGTIPPTEFMDISEKKEKTPLIGNYLLDHVCRIYRELNLEKVGLELVEIKLTRLQCMSENLVDDFVNIVKKYNLDCSHIGLEIAENALVGNQKIVSNNLLALKNAGFKLSIDDYGMGGLSPIRLFDLPFDYIRMDKGMLWAAMERTSIKTFYTNSVRMAKQLGLCVIAEGIEDVYQKTMAQDLKCDLLQGFYFSKPLSGEAFYRFCLGFNLR